MGFAEAVTQGLSKYATFSGRARRSEYWWFLLFIVLVYAAAIAADAALGLMVLYGVAFFALLLPNLAVSVRRLHDVGRSGWWLLLTLVPFGALVLLLWAVQDSAPGPNEHGPSPKQAEAPV